MKKKLNYLTCMLLAWVMLFMVAFQPVTSAAPAKQKLDVQITSDTQDLMSVTMKVEDRTLYSVKIEKQATKSYLWTSQVIIDGRIVRTTTSEVESIDKNFSAKRLAKELEGLDSGSTTSEDLQLFYEENLKVKKQPISNDDDQTLIPLALPIAVGALTTTAIWALEASALIAVSSVVYDNISDILNEKHQYSQITYSAVETATYVPGWDEFIWGPYYNISSDTSANKHMEEAMVIEVHKRIKNYGNDRNLSIYASTLKTNNVMVVLDIASSLGGITNRHLGNYVDGRVVKDSNYKNIWLDLSGYSVFLIYDRNNSSIFHAHFTPTRLRDREIEYMRYKGSFDLKLYPSFSKDVKYDHNTFGHSDALKAARNNRGLLQDTFSKWSVVPYK